MSIVTLPSTLTNGTTASASDVMANFNAIVAQVNGNLDNSNVVVPRSKLVRAAAAQSIPNVSGTLISFPSLEFDLGGFGTGGGSRLTVPSSLGGIYDIRGYVVWAANASGTRYVAVRKNGSAALVEEECAPNGTAGVRESCSVDTHLSAGDYVELLVVQGSGGALNVTDAFLSLRRVA